MPLTKMELLVMVEITVTHSDDVESPFVMAVRVTRLIFCPTLRADLHCPALSLDDMVPRA